MIEELSYAKKPANPLYRLIINLIFALPILLFLALQLCEFIYAYNLRAMIEQNAAHTQYYIASVDYDFFEDSYTINDLEFFKEDSEIALEIERIEIKSLKKQALLEGNSALLYHSLELENLLYINPNIGMFRLASYSEKDRSVENNFLQELFTHLFSQPASPSLPSYLSAMKVGEIEARQIEFDYHFTIGKGKFRLENLHISPFMQANELLYKVNTKELHVQHRDFFKYNAHELSVEDLLYTNLQAIDLLNFFTLFNQNASYSVRKNFTQREVKQEIQVKNLMYFHNNELTIDFDVLHSTLSVPRIFGNKTSIKSFTLTQAFYDYYEKTIDFYLSDTQKEMREKNSAFEPFAVDLEFDYVLDPSLKQVHLSLALDNTSLFSSKLFLNFILPQDIYTMYENPDNFFGILLTQADLDFEDRGIMNKYIDAIKKKHSFTTNQARQYLFAHMPKTQFHTELQKLFMQKGRLAINLKSGKVLGISDVYGLLLYPMSNDFEISYKPSK